MVFLRLYVFFVTYQITPANVLPQSNGSQSPSSPSMAAYAMSPASRGAAAHHIRSECERFCCEILKALFLGEGQPAFQDSLVLDAQSHHRQNNGLGMYLSEDSLEGMAELSPESSLSSVDSRAAGLATGFFELFDYIGGGKFQGFVAQKADMKAVFVFFDRQILSHNLKAGYAPIMKCLNQSKC